MRLFFRGACIAPLGSPSGGAAEHSEAERAAPLMPEPLPLAPPLGELSSFSSTERAAPLKLEHPHPLRHASRATSPKGGGKRLRPLMPAPTPLAPPLGELSGAARLRGRPHSNLSIHTLSVTLRVPPPPKGEARGCAHSCLRPLPWLPLWGSWRAQPD